MRNQLALSGDPRGRRARSGWPDLSAPGRRDAVTATAVPITLLRGDLRLATRNAAERLFRLRQPPHFQTALGLIWLLDGILQFQPFMYSKGFIALLTGTASGQPYWLASSIDWASHITQHDMTVFNTLFALIQVSIGLGLLYRRTVKLALALSFAWALGVWWFSEGFGMLFAGTANPSRARPVLCSCTRSSVSLSGLESVAGGLLGARGARTAWATLWLVMAWSWLLAPNSSANATANAIMSAPGGGWLHSLQSSVASSAKGHGLVIALVLALCPSRSESRWRRTGGRSRSSRSRSC